MRSRTHKKQFWFNDIEESTLKEKSSLAGMNESDFIRSLVLGYELKVKPDDNFYKTIRLFRSISNNLNQIATKAHSLNFIDELSYRKEVEQMDKLIDDLKIKYLNYIPSNNIK